ncbi:MAG: hypothetical protein SVT56_05155 [Chloroflexota bacterium]|jgi:uncharacterized membrane protein YesL|nr:hypothetical protein [Chloroflexota bacterium]
MFKTVCFILRDSLLDIWQDLWTTLVCNSIWLAANLLIIPGPPATIALYSYANKKANQEEADHKDFWKVFINSWGIGWRWGALNLIFLIFLIGDICLSSFITNPTLKAYMVGLYIAIGLGWFLLQTLALPFLFEQEQLNVQTALRNAIVLIGKNLLFIVLIVLSLIVILIFGTILSLLSVMFGAVFIALVSSRVVKNRLEFSESEEKCAK